jgi:hypothetical protein
MILHLSLPALDPQVTAKTLAELVGGIHKPLSWCKNGYMVFTHSEFAIGIEVLPYQTVFMPGSSTNEPLIMRSASKEPQYDCVHFLLVIDNSYEHIFKVAGKAGWRAIFKRSLGAIDMVELWVENRFMIEVILKQHQQTTIDALKIENYRGI